MGSGITSFLFLTGFAKSAVYKGTKQTLHNFSGIVESGHLAIKFNKLYGLGDPIYTEGWNFKLPYLEKPIIFDVR